MAARSSNPARLGADLDRRAGSDPSMAVLSTRSGAAHGRGAP